MQFSSKVLAVALAAIACGQEPAQQQQLAELQQPTGPASVATQAVSDYIVVLRGTGDPAPVAERHGKRHGFEVEAVYKHALKGYAARIPQKALANLQADPDVLFVAEDSDFRLAAFDFGPFLGFAADRIDGDTSSTRSGDGAGSVPINIAIIDSGVDASHPDLRVEGGVDCTQKKPRAVRPVDEHGHGTAVAGAAAALDNETGFVGIAPGAPLWSARVVNKQGRIKKNFILCAVDWVTSTRSDGDPGNDIAVANISITGDGANDGNCGLSNRDPLHLAICNSVAAGVTYVVASGNDSSDFAELVPAAYDEVLTATSMADFDGVPGGVGTAAEHCDLASEFQDDTFAVFSNFATQQADRAHTVAAPGFCVETSVPGGYTIVDGTSFSSPLIAGTVALCIFSGDCAGLTPPQIMQKIVADATAYNGANPDYGYDGDPLRPTDDRYYGFLIRAGLY